MIIVALVLLAASQVLLALVIRVLVHGRFRTKEQPKKVEEEQQPDYFHALYERSKPVKQRLGSLGYPLSQKEQGQLAMELLSFSNATIAVLTYYYNKANLLSEQEELLQGLLKGVPTSGHLVFSRDPSRVPTSVIAIADFLKANGAEGCTTFQDYTIELQPKNNGLDYESKSIL